MKKMKLKIFAMLISCLVLMQTQQVFCQADVVNALNKIFVMDTEGGSRQQSTIDKKIDMYVQQFYNLYSTDKNFIFDKIQDNTASNNVSDLFDITKRVESGVEKFIKQDIFYNTQSSPDIQYKDKAALLAVKAEGGNNNISFGDIKDEMKGGNRYGSVYDPDVDRGPVDDTFKDILNVQTLIGPDGYSKEETKNARLFINQLLQSTPLPKIFYIPAPDKAVNIGSNEKGVYMYLPYQYVDKENPDNNTPYRKVPISTAEKKCPLTSSNCDRRSDYAGMLDILNKNSIYQEYKAKIRSKLALRTLYLSSLLHIFQKRTKASDKDKSLVEKEKEMALVGLTQKYYNNLKNKTVADVNLETLYALNKIVYFLHKLHQDNERVQLIAAISGLQFQPMDIQDEKLYIKPIGALIENSCWDLSLEKVPSGVPRGEQREAICKNPQKAAERSE